MILQTDLHGFIHEITTNRSVHLGLIVLSGVIVYLVVMMYVSSSRSNFNDILVGTVYGTGSRCSENIPKMDEILFKNMIDLPNRDPRMLTTSMVIPEIRVKDEERRKTRMDILNMFYNSFDDDFTSYNSRPKGLYLIP